MPTKTPIEFYPDLAKILEPLRSQKDNFDQFPKTVHIDEIIGTSGINKDSLLYLLSFLQILGFIEYDDKDNIKVISKYSGLSINAIIARLNLHEPATKNLRDSEKKTYYKNFTSNLEFVRHKLHGENIPIHYREMVNIIIKGKQIRKWKYIDVYLHVYHEELKQYHLVGLGKRDEKSTQILVEKAIEQRLGLNKMNFEVDSNFAPQPIEYNEISKSHGALTHYTIHTRIVHIKDIDLNKHLEKLISENDAITEKTFKWFSREEIEFHSSNDALIMESSHRLLDSVGDLSNINTSVPKAKNFSPGKLIEVKTDISNRVTVKKGILYVILVFFLFIFIPNLGEILYYINIDIPWLSNMDSLLTIISIVLTTAFMFKDEVRPN